MPPSLLDADFDGKVNLTVAAKGTISQPNLSGNFDGKDLQFTLPSEGVNFMNGELQASFDHDKLLITKATWQGGNGNLQAHGYLLIDKGKPQIDLDWTAEKFTAISRADRFLTFKWRW